MLSAYTTPHRYSSRRDKQRVPLNDTTVDTPLYRRKNVYHVSDRLEIETGEERSYYETGRFTFLQESDGRHGSIYYPSSLPSFRVPPVDRKKRKKKRRDETMSSLFRSINAPLQHRQNLSTFLDVDEQQRIAELLGKKTEVQSSGIAQLLYSNGSSWEERSRGVVCYAKDFENKTKAIVIVDPSTDKATIVDAFKMSSISQISMASHKFLITFEVDSETVMGLNFHSDTEASQFYRNLVEVQQKSEVRRSMRDTTRSKQPQASKVSPLSQQSTSSRDSGIIEDQPPRIVEESRKKEEPKKDKSKGILGLFFSSSSDRKKKKKEKKEKERERSGSQSTFHVATPSSSSVQWNGGSTDRKIDWKSDSPSSSITQSLPPPKIEFKKGGAFTDMWDDEPVQKGFSVPASKLTPDHLTIIPTTMPDPTDYESVAPSQLLLTTRSGSIENAVIRNSIRVKHSTPAGRRPTPKEIKSASDAKRADRHWESSMVGSALPSPLPSFDTLPPQQSRGPLPTPHSRSPSPPPVIPRHRSLNNNVSSTRPSTIFIQSSPSPLSPPPSYPPPPPPPSETTVVSHDDDPPPPPAPHRTESSTVAASRSIDTVPPSAPPPPPPGPPPPPPVESSTVPQPPPPPPPTATITVSTPKNGAPPINDLLSQIRSVNKDNLLKSVDKSERVDRSPTTPSAGGGIMGSLAKEIEKRRTVMNESSDDEDSSSSDDSDWSE